MILRTRRHGLVGAWCPSLRAGGYVLEDRSEARYNGTLTGNPTWSEGALSFTAASSQYVAIWDSARVNQWTGGPMSVSAWIKPTSVSGTQGVVSTIASNGGGCTFQLEIGRTPGKVVWLQSGSAVTATSAAAISANVWSFIAATRYKDGSNWKLSLFINNVLETFTTNEAPTANSTGTLSIGRPGAFNGLYFGGLIDDVRIWNRWLSPSEIQAVSTARGFGLLPQRARRLNRLGSQFYANVGGTWKTATPWIKVGGVWKQATPALNVSGTWK